MSGKSSIDIYDCLEQFQKPEKLNEENAWYCNTCKKHVLAYKKMSIYKTPKYLAIALMRFRTGKVVKRRYYGYMQQGGGKIDTKISFPIKNLDLTNFVLNDNLPSNYLNS